MTLALEFSSTRRSVALALAGRVVAEAVHEDAGHTPAIALARRVLAQSGMGRESIERIAVGLGPGSYAGIRSALALAQGWSLKGGVEVVGVSSLSALIRGIPGDRVGDGTEALVLLDAQRGEFHGQRVVFRQDCWRPDGDLLLLTKEGAKGAMADGTRILGPEVRRWFSEGTECYPTAWHVANLGSMMKPVGPPEVLEPIYLRSILFLKTPPPRQDLLDGLSF